MAFLRSLLLILCGLQFTNATCFISEITTTPRVGYGSLRTNTMGDCETACEADTVCISFAYSDAQKLCVFHNADPVDRRVLPCGAAASYERWVKTTSGCPTTTTTSTTTTTTMTTTTGCVTTIPQADPADDPCILQAYPELTSRVIGQPPCPRRNPDGSEGPLLVVRAYHRGGALMTLANIEVLTPGQPDCAALLRASKSSHTEAAKGYVCATINEAACPCTKIAIAPAGATCEPPPGVPDINMCPNSLLYVDMDNSTLMTVPGASSFVKCSHDRIDIFSTSPPYAPQYMEQLCCGP